MRTTVTALKGKNKDLGKISKYILVCWSVLAVAAHSEYCILFFAEDLNQASQTQNKEMENAQTKIQGQKKVNKLQK